MERIKVSDAWYLVALMMSLSLIIPSGKACPTKCQCLENRVNCAKKGFTSLPPDLPVGMIELNFTENQLTYIGPREFSRFTNLETLDLSHNRINTISLEAFSNLLKVLKLNLASNVISKLEQRTFVDMSKVTTIDLSYNPLVDLPRNIFQDCPWLSRLELRNTLLNQEDFAELNMVTRLEFLEISKNNFTQLPYLMLSKLNSLRNLYLVDSNIQHIDNNAFVGLRSLQTLDMSGNRIEKLNRETFQAMESLAFLDVSGNNLRCSCGTAQFQDWLKQKGVSLMSAAKCKSGENIEYDVHYEDLSSFCTLIAPTSQPPGACGADGKIKLSVYELVQTKVEITWSYKSIPLESHLIGVLRIYEKEDSELWYDFIIGDGGHKFENLTSNSPYTLCTYQKDCMLYTCVDFRTGHDPNTGTKLDTECIPLETSLGIGVAVGAVFLIAGMAIIFLILKGACRCKKAKNDPEDLPKGPVRQTQPVIPLQISQSYVPSGNARHNKRFQSVTSDTYDAIPLEPTDPNRSELFFNLGYKERPRHVNDPLPPIVVTDGMPTTNEMVINGISSCYLHPDTEGCNEPEQNAAIVNTPSRPDVAANRVPGQQLASVSPVVRQEPKGNVDVKFRRTTNDASSIVSSDSEPYHLYTEAHDLDIDISPAIPDKATLPQKLHKLLTVNNPSLEDLKKRIDGSTGKVKKFSRPKLTEQFPGTVSPGLMRNRSFSTPDILSLRNKYQPENHARDLRSDT